jgi:CheY-like chemotaxis protein
MGPGRLGRGGQSNHRAILRDVAVLVVEGDPATARLMSILLDNEECNVRVVGSAEDALALLPAFPAQIAVVDLVLPRMSGMLLARQLKAAASTRDIVLVAVSFADRHHIARVAREVGCAAYLPKPIDARILVQTLARLVARDDATGG